MSPIHHTNLIQKFWHDIIGRGLCRRLPYTWLHTQSELMKLMN